MNLEQYVKDATATESKIEVVKADPNLLLGSVQILISAGMILDQVKKQTFYDAPIDTDKTTAAFGSIIAALETLKIALTDGVEPVEITDYDPRVFHSIVGIATESVELLELLGGEGFDRVNFLEELGDLNWYEAIGIDAVDGNFESVLNTNIAKLKKRYPDKFTKEAANNRDLSEERSVLESVD